MLFSYFKSERVKQLLNQGRFRPLLFNDPLAALQRDSFAAAEARVDEAEIRSIANQQMATLENLVIQQRRSQMRLARILRDAEERHRKVGFYVSFILFCVDAFDDSVQLKAFYQKILNSRFKMAVWNFGRVAVLPGS